MGRGRNGIWSQSLKKVKTIRNRHPDEHLSFYANGKQGQVTEPPVHISDELLTAMKKMSPQDLKNALIQPDTILDGISEEVEQVEEVDLTEMEEYDLTGPGEPVYETPIMTPQLYRRIMANEFSQDQVEYIIKKALKN